MPFSRAATFVRQLLHDVRNSLNAVDLQLSLLEDQAQGNSEMITDVRSARRMIGTEARRLTQLSAQFRPAGAERVEYQVSDLVEDIRDRVQREFPKEAPQMEWVTDDASGSVSIDFEMISAVLMELIRNAVYFRKGAGPVRVTVATEGDQLEVKVSQPAAEVAGNAAEWGKEAFVTTRRGGYGLGLFAARRTVEALDGEMNSSFDDKEQRVSVSLSLPLV